MRSENYPGFREQSDNEDRHMETPTQLFEQLHQIAPQQDWDKHIASPIFLETIDNRKDDADNELKYVY